MSKATHLFLVVLGLAMWSGCGSDDDAPAEEPARPENTGSACESAADCYPDVDGEILGEVQCLDRVKDGYCTHLCESDGDCCAVEGECAAGITQVCSPFENTEQHMCFLSCEPEDLPAGADGREDENAYCQAEAGTEFICRSSGGGSNNRKVCVPGNCGLGAACETDADCDGDLTCLSDFSGGYCGVEGCAADADCPENSACVEHSNGTNYCFAICKSDVDCSFCRFDGAAESCTADVTFVEPGDLSVCPPPTR